MNAPALEKTLAQSLVLAMVIYLGISGTAWARAQNAQTPAQPGLPDAPPPASQAAPQGASPFAGHQRPRGESSSADAPLPAAAPVTVFEETVLHVQTIGAINSNSAKEGDALQFLLDENVIAGDTLAIPRGALVHGVVVRCKRPSTLTGSPELTLKLVSLDLGGRTYPLYSHQLRVKGTSKTPFTRNAIAGGAAVGALAANVNYLQNGGTSNSGQVAAMGKGAAAGAGVGTVVAATTPGPEIRIPAEAEVEFSLAAPITVDPVSTDETARLAEGLNSGGPSLYVRGEIP